MNTFYWQEPSLKDWDFSDGIKWSTPTPDYEADSEAEYRKLEEEDMKRTEEDLKPDHRTGIKEGYVNERDMFCRTGIHYFWMNYFY